MFQSYEAIYDHGKIKWLGDQPANMTAHVIVTILPDKTMESVLKASHKPSPLIAGKGKVLGDIVKPAASESDWNCLK